MKRVQVNGLLLLLLAASSLLLSNYIVEAQTTQISNATTDPLEAAALNSIFQQWGISAPENQWNISGELCSGFALGDTPTIDTRSYNPFIKCDCTYNSSTICHITALKVYALNAVGVLPDEMWTLRYITNLNLGQNFLTGPLPESIGNLTRMQWLTFGINSLSGPLPRSIGLLTDLRLFSIGSNGFSGPLPSELGSCRMLQQLYIDSSGVSGEIPETFTNLTEMVTVWASNVNLTGRIPDFIGNWTKLQTLRFEGNSFEGAIPSSFSNLTSLVELRITDLENGSSSLDFIRNLKSLTALSLRNNDLFGSIPSDIGDFVNLTTILDLSFNNLTGQIPTSLFNLSLTHLFLGNNGLSGSLPTQKNSVLRNIDVSYNNLTGSIPSWVSEDNLQLNLIANNFTLDSSIDRYLPSGLNCLQRGFPCNRNSPIYSQFAIKCGGPQITSSSGIEYERENETLGPATYRVASTNRWAVSNVGYFTGTNNAQYTFSSSSQFANTLDSELFQTCRLSPSSLRYYGLGLENGDYTVNLQFAEIVIPNDNNRWQSLGKRLFDIYIQGDRVSTDFNIRARAGGQSFRVVPMNFTALVTENYLEIHLFWAGKGTCCIPFQGSYGPSVSAISATPNFRPTVSNELPSFGRDNTVLIALIVGIVVGIGTTCFMLIFAVFFIIRRKRLQRSRDDEVLIGIDNKPYTYHYSELKTATEDFSPNNKLGEGGFGPVYKGKLGDGRVIAVKQLSVQSHQGKNQFVTEIATISAVQHRNLVKLHGCCIEGDNRMLVYEFLENKSLDQALFGERSLNLVWPTRFDICMGVARGLAYLHEESRLRIVHRDVKASNILLDSELVPKISDFGLAKLYDDKKTHISTRVAGTIGYLAPEYAMRGLLTEKADVFAFGVVALEIISGRPNSDPSLEENKVYLLEWAWHLHENNRNAELLDTSVSEFDEEELIRMIGVSLLCTQASPNLRPSMSRVVAMLTGDAEVGNVTSRPGYLTDWKFDDISKFMSENPTLGTDYSHYNSSRSITTFHSPTEPSKPMLNEIIGDGR